MTLEMPKTVARYFQADQASGAAVANCFTEDAVVKDEGNTYRGLAAIRRWKDEASAKYTYTCEPLQSESQNDNVVVTCRLEGNFPGSPTTLRYFFTLESEQIAALTIVP